MYVIIGNLGKKLRNLAKVLVLLLALGVLVPGAIALYNRYGPAVST